MFEILNPNSTARVSATFVVFLKAITWLHLPYLEKRRWGFLIHATFSFFFFLTGSSCQPTPLSVDCVGWAQGVSFCLTLRERINAAAEGLSAAGGHRAAPGAVSAARRAVNGGGDGRSVGGNPAVRAGDPPPEEAARFEAKARRQAAHSRSVCDQ